MMDEEEFYYCHYDYEDEEHDCLDYMECEECPYYYADLDQVVERMRIKRNCANCIKKYRCIKSPYFGKGE